MSSPEPSYREELHRMAGEVGQVRQRLTQFLLHGEHGDSAMPMTASWQPVSGRPGVECYHVPHPDGRPELFAGLFRVAAGTHFEGSSMDESRLIVTLDGAMMLNGQAQRPGTAHYLAPGEPASWHVEQGHLSVTIYDVPPPDLDLTLLPATSLANG